LKTKIIVALDVDNLARAKYFVNRLYPEIKLFKVGLRLFTACGPEIIKFIRGKGGESFLDLKFFDIPNTVAHAVRQAARLKIKMLTLHIAGGREMLLSAVRAAKEESAKLKIKRPLLIGVTVLTSEKATAQAVLRLANIGLDCGLDGAVCSVWEARALREKIKKRFIIVTPGIRPKGYLADDQKRTATAADALAAGADYIVVGRPILEAKEPLKAVRGLI